MGEKRSFGNKMLTVVFVIISVIYMIPIFEVLMNSFKANSFVNTDTFALPNAESFVGWDNYIKGMTFGNYPFLKSVFFSLFITVVGRIHIAHSCKLYHIRPRRGVCVQESAAGERCGWNGHGPGLYICDHHRGFHT